MDKIGLNVVVIGAPGEGKTYFIRQLLRRMRAPRQYIFDPNEEYTERNDYPGPMTPESFGNFCNQNSRLAVNVFEEATFFLTHGSRQREIVELITRKRHKRIVNIFVFHSINTLPAWVLPMIDNIILFKTRDRADLIRTKYESNPELYEAFNQVQSLGKYQYKDINLR